MQRTVLYLVGLAMRFPLTILAIAVYTLLLPAVLIVKVVVLVACTLLVALTYPPIALVILAFAALKNDASIARNELGYPGRAWRTLVEDVLGSPAASARRSYSALVYFCLFGW